MKKRLNLDTILWCVGVAQPLTFQELHICLSTFTGVKLDQIDLLDLKASLKEAYAATFITSFEFDDHEFFSLTLSGNNRLPRAMRLLRDKTRLHLLNVMRWRKVKPSREAPEETSAGVSPTKGTSTNTKARAAKKLWPAPASAKVSWPRSVGQLLEAGSSSVSREPFPALFSFDDFPALIRAGGKANDFRKLRSVDLGLILGISSSLIEKIRYSSKPFYRTFFLKKKGGGRRRIDSPRVFLKVIQRFVSDYIFTNLPVHSAVNSFRHERSIATNAAPHVGKKFVGKTDITDFFGSISEDLIFETLRKYGYHFDTALLFAEVCTLHGRIPQGAPSSPILSNSILYDFDLKMSDWCVRRNLDYTRYSDDITISGGSHHDVALALENCKNWLSKMFDFSVREDKTRISNQGGQQRVTGVVVNARAAPPREYRRKVRAMFHKASKKTKISKDERNSLAGHLHYLMNFPDLKSSQELEKYRRFLEDAS